MSPFVSYVYVFKILKVLVTMVSIDFLTILRKVQIFNNTRQEAAFCSKLFLKSFKEKNKIEKCTGQFWVDFKPGSSRVVTNRAIHNTKSHDT
jgi:hypothetical protein